MSSLSVFVLLLNEQSLQTGGDSLMVSGDFPRWPPPYRALTLLRHDLESRLALPVLGQQLVADLVEIVR